MPTLDRRVAPAGAGALALTLVLGIAAPAAAIPAFARRYQVGCTYCHDGFPKLNAVGRRFKEDGFRLDQEGPFDARAWIRSAPLILRGSLNRSLVEDRSGATASFGKLVSAGNLGRRLSYWADDGFSISGGDVVHTKPDNAWLRLELLPQGRLYARGGRIEMDLPFSQARTPHLLSYDIYFANAGVETDTIAQNKDGVELGGRLPGDLHWSAAVVKGHRDPGLDGSAPAVFVRIAKQRERQRFGAFAYLGQSKLSAAPPASWDDRLLRLGGDADVTIERLDLYAVLMYGRNANPAGSVAQPAGTHLPSSFGGGFAQADYRAKDWLSVTLRANSVDEAAEAGGSGRNTFASLVPGLQVFIFEHGKISFEYAFQNRGRPRIGALQAEFAF